MISIRFALNPRFSRSSKLFLVCIMLIAFGGVLQAIAEEPVPIMVEQLAVGEAAGAEDVAIDAQGRIYGGMVDGRIIRYQPDGSQPEVFATIEEGRPLGLDFDPDGNLIVADANKGLLSISPDGAITVLSTEYDGVPYGLANDVDVAEDGTIYFSDSSCECSLDTALTELQEAPGQYGRLLKYDPETQTTELVLGDLWFANGVAVSPDQSFVLVMEMAENRIARYWLTGPDAGQSDIFVENLPVWPDGVSSNGQDMFWVAVLGEGLALGLDLDGNVVHNLHPLYPSGEPYAAVASVEEHEGMIYLGHLEDDFIPRLALENIATAETLEANKARVRRIYDEIINPKDLSLVDEFYATDYVFHLAGMPDIHGPEGFKQMFAMYFAAFPDLHYTIEDLIAEGDMVAGRWTFTGTHQSEFMGIPPTLKQVKMTGIGIQRYADGKVVEDWGNADMMGLMQQLGAIPPAGNENYTWGVPSEVTGAPGNPEANKTIVRRVFDEVFNQKNLDLVDELFATDYVWHIPPNPETHGSEGFKQFFAMQFAAFPDSHITAEDVLAEGDRVVTRWTFTGTHEGELMGIPPTGKQVTYTGIVITRFADGKIVEDWEIVDSLGMMQQLTAPPPVDTEANKAIALRVWEEIYNQRNLDLIDEIFATDYVGHVASMPDRGIEGFKQVVAIELAAVPDIHVTVEELIAEGDMVASRWTMTGTHEGEFMGIPPTGKQVTVTGIVTHRIISGKIVEDWAVYDILGLMQQLGAIPADREDYTWGVPSEVTGEPGDPEENKAILRRVTEEVLSQQNLDIVDEFYATDYVYHLPGSPEIHGPEGFKQYCSTLFAAAPDFHITIEDMFAEGDKVVQRVTATGTHQGEFMGIPPTGKQFNVTGILIQRYADGKIVEDWEIVDFMSFMQQITAPTVDTEANKAIVRRAYEEVTNQGNLDVIDEIFAADYVFHMAGMPDVHGPEGMKQFVAMLRAAFPELHETVEDMIVEGDMVASRVTVNYGAHQGEFIGIPPTGNQATATMMVIHRITSGKIVEDWGICDTLGLMEQLGVVPAEPKDYTWGVPSEVTGEPGDPEANKAIVRRVFEEVLNQRNLPLADEIYATDYVGHIPPNPEIRGSEGFKQFFAMQFAAFPDSHLTIEDMFAEGDKVVTRWSSTSTHKGELMGIPPTGKQVTITGILIQRFADGKIVEDWENYDVLGMMQQLGVIPPMVPKDYSNVFFMPLTPGLNMISLPLESQTPYTARSFAEKLSATAVITLDEARQKFVGFTLDAPDDGFQIEGGKGYIVNVPEGGMVAFTGAAWTRPPMPAPEVSQSQGLRLPIGYPAQTDSAWAFVVSGRFVDDSADSLKKDGYLVTVRNTRTNAVATDVVRSRYFAAAFADLNRKNVVQTGDRLEIQLRNRAGEIVSDTLTYTVTTEAIRQAFMPLTLKNVEIPRQSLLLPNYPNPFNPETWIPYQLREPAEVFIRIYNAKGQLVRTLDLGQRAAGFYLGRTRAAHWDGHNDAGEKVASGIYFYQLQAGDFSSTRRMLVLK